MGLACLALSACGLLNWRARVTTDAEAQIRTELGDPSAQFSPVEVTGNSSTGQTCASVTVEPAGNAHRSTGRFIVYIDKTAGPFIEPSIGYFTVSQSQFDFAWQHDCVDEGYRG